jgi:hypothetical protein
MPEEQNERPLLPRTSRLKAGYLSKLASNVLRAAFLTEDQSPIL